MQNPNDPQQIYAMIAKLPDNALQQGMASPQAPPLIKLALMTEYGYRQKARQGQSSEPSAPTDMMTEMAQGQYQPYPAPKYVAPKPMGGGIASLQGPQNQGANPQAPNQPDPTSNAGIGNMFNASNGGMG